MWRIAALGRETVHVVEHLEESSDEGGLCAIAQLGPLAGVPLAEVVVLGGEPEVLLARGVELLLETPDRLVGLLDGKRPAFTTLAEHGPIGVVHAAGLGCGHVGGCQVGAVGAPPRRRSRRAHAARGVNGGGLGLLVSCKSATVSHLDAHI